MVRRDKALLHYDIYKQFSRKIVEVTVDVDPVIFVK